MPHSQSPRRTSFILVASLALVPFVWVGASVQSKIKSNGFAWHDGDIVFQCSVSTQCPAIAQATHSPYTHCGIVFMEDGKPMVWEAVGPVRKTPYAQWVRHGANGHVVVKRLRDPEALNPQAIEAMRVEGEREMGRPYDIWFNMDDERIYCSELVWKIYERGAHIEPGTVERFGDMDFSGTEARRVLKERFGDRFPADQQVITPASLFRSPLLMTVDSIGVPPVAQ
ncbi:MAG: YiiX/YebB-like N1pC/P60 family cysteine hydrolase [Flavobacteriales bacterium]